MQASCLLRLENPRKAADSAASLLGVGTVQRGSVRERRALCGPYCCLVVLVSGDSDGGVFVFLYVYVCVCVWDAGCGRDTGGSQHIGYAAHGMHIRCPVAKCWLQGSTSAGRWSIHAFHTSLSARVRVCLCACVVFWKLRPRHQATCYATFALIRSNSCSIRRRVRHWNHGGSLLLVIFSTKHYLDYLDNDKLCGKKMYSVGLLIIYQTIDTYLYRYRVARNVRAATLYQFLEAATFFSQAV